MPNRFHYRARIENLWRHADSNAPAYRRLKSLDAITRELFAPNDRARRNYALFLATDPYDVARHKLRDLYDHASPESPLPTSLPSPPAVRRGEMPQAEGGFPLEDEPLEEDADPL